MKKIIYSALFAVMMSSLTTNTYAQDIVVEVDGYPVTFDQPPVIQEGRTLVPMRAVFEALGAEVQWDDINRCANAVRGDVSISIGINQNYINVNGSPVVLDVPATIINDRTMVPIRAISEAFNCGVEWDGVNQKVIVTTTTLSDNSSFSIHYIDVGQADCALILCDGKSMLIDGGNPSDSSLVVSYLTKNYVQSLDYMLCTHAHDDHVGGLPGPLSVMNVGAVFAPTAENDIKSYNSFKEKATQQGLEILHPYTGYTLNLGSSKVEFIAPTYVDTTDLNNTSIMCKISYGDTSFLFTGDAEYDEEMNILSQGVDISADVLKVGHHGSDSSTSYVFLREVMPEYAVISVGAGNSYGHPEATVLSRLHDAGTMVYRTDIHGDIVATSDGNTISFTTAKSAAVQSAQIQNTTEQPADTSAEDGEILYIGNKNTKKLHLPSCESLPKESNREYYANREEAIEDGYVPCKNCAP